jgi:hypothetical protein
MAFHEPGVPRHVWLHVPVVATVLAALGATTDTPGVGAYGACLPVRCTIPGPGSAARTRGLVGRRQN